ncbi:C4G15 protein, partial [Acromyrmex heyeri]
MLLIIIVLSLICVVISYFVQDYRLFSSRTVKPLSGPIRLPFIGSTYHFLQRNSEDFLNVCIKFAETYPSPFRIWIGPKLIITIYEPNQIKIILQNRHCLNKSLVYKCLEPIFGMGLVTAPGEYVLPKGADVFIMFIQMHRNEKYWPNPMMFNPDRFLPEKRNCMPYYYMPFSDGPRNCMGSKYAMMSMKVILATLIRTFVFKLNQSIEIDKIKLNSDIVLSIAEPIKIRIEKRNL